MIKHLIIANKISDATYNKQSVKIFSTCADCKSTDSLNRNKPKYLGFYMSTIQPLCFFLYNPKCGCFLNNSLVLTSRL